MARIGRFPAFVIGRVLVLIAAVITAAALGGLTFMTALEALRRSASSR
ncbi:MAG: hypothetical protein ACYSTY_10015 [Planctomycetota bacterium]